MTDAPEPTPPVAPRPRGWWSLFALSTALFVLGGIAGAALTLAVIRSNSPWRFDAPPFRPERIAERLARDLDLTPAQTEEIRNIFRAQHEELQAIRRDAEPRVREVLDRTHALVMAELTDAQQAAWEERYERMRRRMRAPGWQRPRETRDPDRLIERFDRDGNARLSREELAAAWKRLSAEQFERMDRNGDGALDAEELRAARPRDPAEGPPNE